MSTSRNKTFLTVFLFATSLLFSSATLRAAVYQEAGGVVVIEAYHFDYRNYEFTDAAIPHHFHIVPDENGTDQWADTGNNPNDPSGLNMIANSRSGHYIQIVPDNGQNKGNCATCPNKNVGFPPYVEYKVNITTVGTYQLYLRQVGWDGGSDSFFAQILEFAPPGPGPNFYRYAPDPDSGDFAALRNNPADATTADQGWSGYAAPAPRVDGGGGEVKALYNITTPGLYSIRLSQREDGAAVDAVILQLASLPAPVNSPPPPESAISVTAPPYVRAVEPTPGQEQVPPDNNVGGQIVDGVTKQVNTNSIRLVVDGLTVSPSITKTGSVTYVAYQPSPLLTSGKAITWTISFSDNAVPPASYSNSFPFTVLAYSPIPTNFATPPGTVDLTKPGFRIKPYQTTEANPVGNSIAWTEEQLKGLHGPNTADLTGVDASGYLAWTNVVNFDIDGPAGVGTGQNFIPSELFPGQTVAGPYDNSALEVLTYLNLKAGVYRMIVNSDDGFKVSVGADPRDVAGLVLGSFDDPAGRAATDSLFIFVVQTDGFYPFRLVWQNGGGGASVEWFTQNVFGRKALVNSSTNGTVAVKAYRSGPSLPYISRFSFTPVGFSLDYNDNGGIVINKDTIQVTLDASPVTANVGKTNGVTTISYTSPTILASGSTHTIGLTFSDTSSPPVTRTRSVDFTLGTYATIPPGYAVGAPDTTKPGFKVRVNQIDDPGPTVEPNTIAFAEQQLAGMVTNAATGQLYTNSATANPADNSFVYPETGVINYDATGTGNNGNFTPDNQMPGFPGSGPTGGSDNAAAEILTYLTLPAGLVTMGVNSDDGFRLSPATSVSDPQNALTLGIFDAGRGAADSLFDVYVQQAGTYPMRLVWENGNGGANVEWFTVLADGSKILINDTNAVALKAYRAAAGAQPAVRITSARINNGIITIQWTGGGTLESTLSLTSPVWTSTGNSSGTFSEPATGTTKFYRVKL